MRKRSENRRKKLLYFVVFFAIVLTGIVLLMDYVPKLFYPARYTDMIERYSREYGLDPYLVLAIMKVESDFRPGAVSPKNARGLMQISEKTGRWGAEKLHLDNYTNDSLFEPETNITIGCWYLSVLFEEFGETDLVLAAYNGGSGNVAKWLGDSSLSSDGKSLDRIPFKETEQYLKKVKSNYKVYKRLYENVF